MTWNSSRTLPCADCGALMERKNPKTCADGKLRCRVCKSKYANRRFEQEHGTSRYEKYHKGDPQHTRYARYAMSMEDYDRLLERQGGVCAICKFPSEENLVVDHDHVTGTVRGLLCNPCNRAIGQLKDSVPTLQAAIYYLQRTGADRSWDGYFLQIAFLAATRSKDPSNQVGAVLVRDRILVSTGYNGFPRGVDDSVDERYDRPLKYKWTVHAEENCLLSAARNGATTLGTTLYVTPLFPCSRCATSIVQAGVKEVVSNDHLKDNPRWKEDFLLSNQILSEAGVVVRPPASTTSSQRVE